MRVGLGGLTGALACLFGVSHDVVPYPVPVSSADPFDRPTADPDTRRCFWIQPAEAIARER